MMQSLFNICQISFYMGLVWIGVLLFFFFIEPILVIFFTVFWVTVIAYPLLLVLQHFIHF